MDKKQALEKLQTAIFENRKTRRIEKIKKAFSAYQAAMADRSLIVRVWLKFLSWFNR